MEYVELKVKQLERLCSPVALDDRGDSTWIEHKVTIYLEEITDDGVVTGVTEIGGFTVFKSAFCRRFETGLALYEEFDMEFPLLCTLVPGYERDGELLHCDDGWRDDAKAMYGLAGLPQYSDVYIIDNLKLRSRYIGGGYGLEALAIYISAYCNSESWVFLYKNEQDCDKLNKHFAKLGFVNMQNGYMIKSCERKCNYRFKQADQWR